MPMNNWRFHTRPIWLAAIIGIALLTINPGLAKALGCGANPTPTCLVEEAEALIRSDSIAGTRAADLAEAGYAWTTLGDRAKGRKLFDEVYAIAQDTEQSDIFYKKTVMEIASAMTRAGDARGPALFDEIVEKLHGDGTGKVFELEEIAIERARIGDLDGAMKTVELLPEWMKIPTLLKIALLRAKNGDRNTASKLADRVLEMMRQIPDPYSGDSSILMTAALLAYIDRQDEALAFASGLAETLQPDAHAGLIMGLAHAGHVAEAKAMLSRIDNRGPDSMYYWALAPVVWAQARNEDIAGAEVSASVENVNDPYFRNTYLTFIAAGRIIAGDTDGAEATLARILDESNRHNVESGVAEALIELGDPAVAEFAARFDDYSFAHMAPDIAAIQVRAGDLTGALATAENVKYEFLRARTLIAVALALAGDRGPGPALIGIIP